MLGDYVKRALHSVGITEEWVEQLIGAPCGCSERAAKLDALDAWARQVLKRGTEGAQQWLRRLLSAS